MSSTLVEAPGVRIQPRFSKAHEVLAAALRARAVAGGEGGSLVQEEQLGEPARAEERPAASLEFEPARYPPPDLPLSDQLAVPVVQDSPVAEQEPPSFGCDDVAERSDSVAQRHPGSGLGHLVHGLLVGELEPGFGDLAALYVQNDHLLLLEGLALAGPPRVVQDHRVLVVR